MKKPMALFKKKSLLSPFLATNSQGTCNSNLTKKVSYRERLIDIYRETRDRV